MSSFAPLAGLNDAASHRRLAVAANAALRGESHNTGRFVAPAGSLSFLLRDERIGTEKVVTLSPLNKAAAILNWWMDENSIKKGCVRVRFTDAAETDALFAYVVTGTKRLTATED